MNQLLQFAEIDSSMIDVVGGKALNLGVMSMAGLPVPDGFCLGTVAYRQVVGDGLRDVLTELDVAQDQEAVAGLAAEARRRILALPVPDALSAAISEHYQALGDDVPVAVRSSATAEDLAYASFAGQQDTYLNIVGTAALIDAIRHCWASLWTDRAVSYRRTNGIDQRTVALAVVVQQMIQATTAGVMFTANPVTGARHETVIDASPGLGEAVVSGAVNPDHFVIDTGTGTIRERRLGDKKIMITSVTGGGTREVALEAGDDKPCLTDDQLADLVALGQRVHDHYGAPQDTEWAIDDQGRPWLTQARPITTLYPQLTSELPDPRVFMCLTLAQGLTRPITPMGLAAFRLIGASVARAAGRPVDEPRNGPRLFATAGQRVFLDLTPLITHALGRRLLITAFGVMEARASTVLRALADDPRFPIGRQSPAAVLAPIVKIAVIKGKAPLRMLTALIRPTAAPKIIDRFERRIRSSLSLPANATPEQRLDLVEGRLGADVFLIMPTTFAYPAVGLFLLNRAKRLLGDLARPDELQTVLRGLPHNVTTEMDLELWRLTTRIRHDQASADAIGGGSTAELTARYRNRTLPPVAQQGVTAFLRRYGHRAVGEIDLGLPRWSDDPSHILGVIANYLRLDDPDLAPERQFLAGMAAAESMITELVGRAAEHHRLKARLIDFALHRARELAGLRESPKYLLVVTLGLLRAQLMKVGEVLVDGGAIEVSDDVFFLDFAEVRRGLTGQSMRLLVDDRRTAYATELRRRHIPRLLLSDGTELEALAGLAERPDGALAGSPASPGIVTGRARVVLDPVGAQLEPGEILIAPSTDPGWTPLFLTAGGLVMEMGGSNSHGAVVAREYGIPAVVGVPDATQKIETGQLVTVDGANGLVSVVPETGPSPGAPGENVP